MERCLRRTRTSNAQSMAFESSHNGSSLFLPLQCHRRLLGNIASPESAVSQSPLTRIKHHTVISSATDAHQHIHNATIHWMLKQEYCNVGSWFYRRISYRILKVKKNGKRVRAIIFRLHIIVVIEKENMKIIHGKHHTLLGQQKTNLLERHSISIVFRDQ